MKNSLEFHTQENASSSSSKMLGGLSVCVCVVTNYSVSLSVLYVVDIDCVIGFS